MSHSKKIGHKHYDRIFRQNIKKILPDIARNFIGVEFSALEPLPTDLPITLDLRPDAVFQVTTTDRQNFLLHIEFQTANESDMAFRMAMYNLLLAHKYKLEVRQVVIYLGSQPSGMETQLPSFMQLKGYSLLNLCEIEYTSLLNTSTPETIIMSVLSNLLDENPKTVLPEIYRRIQSECLDQGHLQKVTQQLIILSQLRNLDSLTHEIIQNMPVIIDFKENILYKEGRKEGREEGVEKGREEGKRQLLLKMWRSGRFSQTEIAESIEVDENELKGLLDLALEEEKKRNRATD